ncbi:hypothetical protein C4573_03550 [Candidatus Woesearchaeota archaeon]|nr:MAG: hypothetical protein C4573_03550 [Candidatus Woesearchaeota archaeon]
METTQLPISAPKKIEAMVLEDNVVNMIKNMEHSGYRPLFMPELVDARISTGRNNPVWKDVATASIKVTGESRHGNYVVVYAHMPHPMLIADHVRNGYDNNQFTQKFGILNMPTVLFQQLLDKEDGKNVFVLDATTAEQSVPEKADMPGIGTIELKVEDAIKHPLVIPFLGGCERAEKYLAKHAKTAGRRISLYNTPDSKYMGSFPIVRFLSNAAWHTGSFDDNWYKPSNTHLWIGVPKSYSIKGDNGKLVLQQGE